SVEVDYDPRELTRDQMVEILDSALDNAEHPTKLDMLDLYTRRLRRPIDGPTRAAIANEYSRRRHEIPVPTELQWHPDKPQFTIRAQWLSFPLSSGSPTMCSRWTRNSRWPPRRSQPRSTVRTPSASSTRLRTTSGSEIVRSLET